MEKIEINFAPKFRELTPEEVLWKEEVRARLPEIRLQSARIRKQLAERTKGMSSPNPSRLDIILR